MIRQEINLHNDFVIPVTLTSYYNWKRFCISNIVVSILFVLMGVFSIFHNFYLQHHANTLHADLTQEKTEFAQLKSKFPPLIFKQSINDTVVSLKKQMAAQKQIIAILNERPLFSEIMLGLSQTIIHNVWLTSITISNTGNDIVINGSSLGMAELNNFVYRLQKYPLFKNYSVILQDVKNDKTQADVVRLNYAIKMAKLK